MKIIFLLSLCYISSNANISIGDFGDYLDAYDDEQSSESSQSIQDLFDLILNKDQATPQLKSTVSPPEDKSAPIEENFTDEK